MRKVITIDGWAATGKSSIAKLVAKKLDWKYLNTGMLYRGIAWLANNEKTTDLVSIVKDHEIDFIFNDRAELFIDGKEVTDLLFTEEISKQASFVANNQELRDLIIPHQRNAFLNHNLVAEGRDMGTVIFPDAPYKFFVEASADVRARRRALQISNDLDEQNKIYQSVKDELILRDDRDSVRTFPANEAIIISNEDLTLEDIVNKIISIIKFS